MNEKEDIERQTKQFVNILRSMADEIEKGEKPLGIVVAWVLEAEPGQAAHSAFSIHQKLGPGLYVNTWRAEASRIMRLMDTVDQNVQAAQPTVFN